MTEMENKENIEENASERTRLKVKILPMKEENEKCEDKIIEECEENDDHEVEDLEEPVSPPPCSLSEAPQLFMSQTIEELAKEVVDQTRKSPVRSEDNYKTSDLPETVVGPKIGSGPCLIPLTVEVLGKPCDANSVANNHANIHMSGGGVYTTDSFFDTYSIAKPSKRPPSITASVIKKVPRKDSKQISCLESLLRQKFSSETTDIVKLPSSLEITPISTKHTCNSQKEVRKRKLESESKADGNTKSDLVITKIPRIDNHKTIPQKNDMIFDCKLLVSKNDKKVKLVFENGLQMFLNKNIFNNMEFENASKSTRKIRRKSKKSKPLNSDVRPDAEKDASDQSGNSEEEGSKLSNHVPATHKLPYVVTRPSKSYLPVKRMKLNNK